MDKNCLIFLMDMEGHPELTDDFAEKYRTYALQDIINDRYLDRDKCVIVSTRLDNRDIDYTDTLSKSQVIRKQARLDKGWNWLLFDKEDTLSTVKHQLQKINFTMSPDKTTIIYGGTSTSGCVLHSSNLSMNKFLNSNYYCQLYLPLCDDSQIAGITSIDRNQKAFALVYQYLKTQGHIENTDILTRFADLDLIRSDRAYDWVAT